MQQTFKTELQKQREERDMKIYLEFEEMRSVEKPRDFDPFGQTGLSPLATI